MLVSYRYLQVSYLRIPSDATVLLRTDQGPHDGMISSKPLRSAPWPGSQHVQAQKNPSVCRVFPLGMMVQ